MTTRRQLLAVALGAANPFTVHAEARTARIGILSALPRQKSVLAPLVLAALADLGLQEGKTMQLQFRSTDGRDELYPRLVGELVGASCDLIIIFSGQIGARTLRDMRTKIPGVFYAIDFDPVASGIVQSLARPGGRLTGVYIPSDALAGKRLELAQEVIPGLRHVAVLTDQDAGFEVAALKRAAEVRKLRVTLVVYTEGLAEALERVSRAGAQAIVVPTTPGLSLRRTEMAAEVDRLRLPAIVPAYFGIEHGGLLVYSVNFHRLARRAAEMAVQILKGANAGEIPVEQPQEFILEVNLKKAKALGIEIPNSVLARATNVVE